jgi:hypothetical protein
MASDTTVSIQIAVKSFFPDGNIDGSIRAWTASAARSRPD